MSTAHITTRHPASFALRHWLALLLLLFAQATLATHHHDAQDLNSHDCTVCSQLQNVKHVAATSKFQVVISTGFIAGVAYQQQVVFVAAVGLPLPRAPPGTAPSFTFV